MKQKETPFKLLPEHVALIEACINGMFKLMTRRELQLMSRDIKAAFDVLEKVKGTQPTLPMIDPEQSVIDAIGE